MYANCGKIPLRQRNCIPSLDLRMGLVARQTDKMLLDTAGIGPLWVNDQLAHHNGDRGEIGLYLSSAALHFKGIIVDSIRKKKKAKQNPTKKIVWDQCGSCSYSEEPAEV